MVNYGEALGLKLFKWKGVLISCKQSWYNLFQPSPWKFLPVSVSFVVGLSTEFHKNYYTDFHQTWLDNWPQAGIDLVNFWWASG